MFKVNAYVTEIVSNHVYSVDIDGFDYAYDDFDFVCCGVKNGVGCYVVTIYDYVW